MESILKLFKKKETVSEENPIEYRYAEDRILKELAEYIDNTYDQHYSQNKLQKDYSKVLEISATK